MSIDITKHLDVDSLSMLQEVMEDEFTLLITTYLNDAKVRIKELTESIESAHAESIRRSAHSFKGSSGNLGVIVIMQKCKLIESKAVDNDLNGMEQLLADVQEEFISVESLLTDRYL